MCTRHHSAHDSSHSLVGSRAILVNRRTAQFPSNSTLPLPLLHRTSFTSPHPPLPPPRRIPSAPLLGVSLDGSARELLFNFTCRFWEQYTTETWGDYGWWNRTVTDGWLQKGTLPTFAYYARNVDPDTNQTVFAISVPYDPLRVTIRVHNTVHPSQYNHTTLVLTAPNLQYTGTANGQVVPLSLPFDLRTLQYNFKRGGRVLLTLAFATSPWGLHSSSSGMPWQLTIEDGTWELPGPRAQVLLTRWCQRRREYVRT